MMLCGIILIFGIFLGGPLSLLFDLDYCFSCYVIAEEAAVRISGPETRLPAFALCNGLFARAEGSAENRRVGFADKVKRG